MNTLHIQYLTRCIAVLITGAALLFIAFSAAAAQSYLQITDISVSSVTGTTATITWRTNVATSARIDFGADSSYGFFLVSGESPRPDHVLTVTNLTPETTYHYSVTAITTGERIASFDRTFKTTKEKDHIGPTITNVSVIYGTGTSATIQWETDENASSVVRYGTTTKYTRTVSGAGNTKIHDVTIRGLTIANAYHFQVESKDKDGNIATWYDRTFSTLFNGDADKVVLQLENIRPITLNDEGLSADGAVVSWRSNKPGTGVVRYGTTTRLGKALTIPGFRTFEHSQRISDLKEDTAYYFTVETIDVFGKTIKSDILSFKTRSKAPAYQYPQGETPVVLGFSTLDRTAPTALFRVLGGIDIFALLKGQLYRLVNLTSLHRYDFARLPTREIARLKLDTYSNVTLVKASDSQTVYYLYRRANNRILKLAIPSPSVFTSYSSNRWDTIVTLDPEEVAEIPAAQLIRGNGSSEIYQLENGHRRLITETQLLQRGFAAADVVGVSTKHLEAIPLGDPI
ncbi:MAG: fibronectin type III domain-containing protein [Candidatus Komeilibacteria bacterium]|nr:fibronectin type III domain-containing protein [Candidatus Komeilibacteria bacterium]